MIENPRTVVTTSWDDGDPLDLKLAEVLAEYGIKGTFYYAPRNRERAVMGASHVRCLAERFEIGAHSLTHPDLRALGSRRLADEVSGGKAALEDLLGRPVPMFCYPKGRYSAQVRRAVMKAGFAGARTTRSFLFAVADRWRMPVTVWARDLAWPWWLPHCARSRSTRGFATLLGRGAGKPWSALALLLFEHALDRGGVWHLWGHSWEIEERRLWSDLRRLLEAVAGRSDVAYLTNGEVIAGLPAAGP